MNETEDEKVTTQSSWNLSSHKIRLIGDLMNRAIAESLGTIEREGFAQYENHYKSFQMWKSIAMLIQNQLKPEEIKKLKTIEKEIHNKCLRKNPEYGGWGGGSKYIYPNILLKRYTPKYIDYVNFLLRKHGMDISSRNLDLEEIE